MDQRSSVVIARQAHGRLSLLAVAAGAVATLAVASPRAAVAGESQHSVQRAPRATDRAIRAYLRGRTGQKDWHPLLLEQPHRGMTPWFAWRDGANGRLALQFGNVAIGKGSRGGTVHPDATGAVRDLYRRSPIARQLAHEHRLTEPPRLSTPRGTRRSTARPRPNRSRGRGRQGPGRP